MHKHPQQTLARVERFVTRELRDRLWLRQAPMDAAVWRPGGRAAPPDAPGQTYQSVEPGFTWGPVWSDAWFRFSGRVPDDWAGEVVCARIDCGAEAIVWDGDDPRQGIDGNHGEYLLEGSAEPGHEVTLYVRANGMNPHVSVDARPQEPPAEPFRFGHAFLAAYDADLWALYHDMKVAWLVLREQPEDSPRRGQLLYALNAAVNAFDAEDRSTVARCRQIVAAVYQRPACPSAHSISAIGHAHIDTAWLWPLERTQQKCLHTFATATRYMELYPEYRFVCSQAQQYEWVKRLAPKLYERIRERIAAGQWEVAGSMWVEADCNITGGESLVRQVLHGKRFWMREFGIETRDLWLPDVFGYAACLPQILRKSGVDCFMTQKISWNQTNRFPHHTFLWEGIDGTRIFTHFPPAETYNASMTPAELAFSVRNFREHDRATRSLYVFGYGDGGGGPTTEMLENARRLADVEGMPRVTLERSGDFFAKAIEDAVDPPVWAGELYLELHRGTYTTQARTKRGNRKGEFLLRDAEFLSCVRPAGLRVYPAESLDRAWKLLLVNQFHDIIPGSSVNEVYRDAERDYAEVARLGEEAVGEALRDIADAVDTRGMERPVLVARNYDKWITGEPVRVALPEGAGATSARYGGSLTPAQVVEQDGARWALFQEQSILEGHGYAVYELSNEPTGEPNTFTVGPRLLDNALLRVEFDERGQISRIYDNLRRREVLAPGAVANQLQLFDDRPLFWDAWDVDLFSQETGKVVTDLESVEVVEAGPVRGAIRLTRRFGRSSLVQTVRLARDHNRLEFVTEVDWHEDRKMLKAAFPVAIHSARATYEIQYGSVERPTHRNTSWDLARFEVAAQKWVDLSEGDYGVALLNDCKYGHDVVGNTLRVTLLRAPKAPDPEADMGLHRFVYALLPHYGDHRRGGVVDHAYRLNAPPRALSLPGGRPGPLQPEMIFFRTDREGVIIEAIKRAEDEDAIIVRLYEAHNTRGDLRLHTSLPVRSAHLCDMLERDQEALPVSEGWVSLRVRPFEIHTVKLRLGG
ncbi:MAG: alpha-mannosidase [Chthonomonadales bacterium]|nr:alpha-mannosidase [Chthonomonadales bacterium]